MSRSRVNELDLLRFLAALAVVFFHYAFRGHAADGLSAMPVPLLAPVAQYGFLGVHLFFLISGFVILMTAADGSLRGFVVSRVVRLYPAFWICCTLTFAAMTLAGSGRALSFGQYLANLTLLGGFVGVPAVDGVYWSLFVELKFYGMVALILAVGLIHRAELLLALWLAVTIALALVPVGILRALLVTDYAPYFIAGAMCFLVRAHGLSVRRLLTILIAWGMALYQSAAELAEFAAHFHRHLDGTAVAVVITLFFAVMLLVATGRTGALGRRRWLALGALTYPLYLLHQNIGYLIFNAAYPAVDADALLWGTVALMLAAAYGVHRLIERPLAARLRLWLNMLPSTNIRPAW